MEGAAQTFLSNAGQLLSKEYQQLRGVGSEIAELRDDLDVLNALLIMESEADDGAAVDRFVQVCMKQLRELAYDAEDCIDLYRLRIKSKPHDGVRDRLKRLFGTLSARRRLAGEIRALRSRAVAISDRQARFGVNRDALRRSTPQLPALMASSSSTPRNDADRRHRRLVGIEEQANSLAARLKAGEEEGERNKASVFSIAGFGGLGKTTLAMEVCRLLEAEFPYQAMVTVSQEFDPSRDLKELLKDLLQQVLKPKTPNDCGVKEEGAVGQIDALSRVELANKLNQLLIDKRYIIVVDDVWTVQAWDAIQSKMPNIKGNRIIVTTRIETVAKACSSESDTGHCIHKMEPLKLEDSKKLFRDRVFGSMDASYPEEFEDVMCNILKKCGGLPLAIVSIASVLVGYKSSGSKDKWDIVCKSIGSQMESHPTLEGMKHILTVSYNHLPHELKGCMIYLSIFPEDYVLGRNILLTRWIAEGLVHQKRGLTMWEVAESYLDELLSRNMIQEVGRLWGYAWNEQRYMVHDILLEVMVSKSLTENIVNIQGGRYNDMFYDKIRRLTIHGNDDRVDSASKRKAVGCRGKDVLNVQHVRSLSMFYLQGHRLLNQLANFTLLRVLDLEGCEGVTNKHVMCACNLYLLRFLNLRGTNVSKVPRQVKNLEYLLVLDVSRTLLVDELPETITKLEKLEHLWFSNKNSYWDTTWTLPRGLNKMKALRKLGRVCLGNDPRVAQEIGELEQLQCLNVSIDEHETDDNVRKVLALSLSKMDSLRWLSIGHRRTHAGKELNFLHSLPTPPQLLQTLWIKGDMDELPSWIGLLTHLVSFTILGTALTSDQLFGVLCKLPNLKTLYVAWRYYSDHDELVARTSQKFPVLRDLILEDYLPQVLRFEEGSMTMLESLELFGCMSRNEVERRIVGMEQLTNLKKVTLHGDMQDNHAMNLSHFS